MSIDSSLICEQAHASLSRNTAIDLEDVVSTTHRSSNQSTVAIQGTTDSAGRHASSAHAHVSSGSGANATRSSFVVVTECTMGFGSLVGQTDISTIDYQEKAKDGLFGSTTHRWRTTSIEAPARKRSHEAGWGNLRKRTERRTRSAISVLKYFSSGAFLLPTGKWL